MKSIIKCYSGSVNQFNVAFVFQAIDHLFQKINEVFCSQYNLVVNVNTTADDIGLLKNIRMNLQTVTVIQHFS